MQGRCCDVVRRPQKMEQLLSMWPQMPEYVWMAELEGGRHQVQERGVKLRLELQMSRSMLALLLQRQLDVLVVPQVLCSGKLPNVCHAQFLMGPVDMERLESRHRPQDIVVIDYRRERFALAAQRSRGQLVDIDDGTDDVFLFGPDRMRCHG